jgi:hypothetical protein
LKHVENKVKPHSGNTKSQKRKNLLLGSSHGREIGRRFEEGLNTGYEIKRIFKPSLSFYNVAEGPWKVGNELTERDYYYSGKARKRG